MKKFDALAGNVFLDAVDGFADGYDTFHPDNAVRAFGLHAAGQSEIRKQK